MKYLDQLMRLSLSDKTRRGSVLPKLPERGFVSFAGSTGDTFPNLEVALDNRIRQMAQRWGYSPVELLDALTGARSDPLAWMAWTERDVRDFGGCVTSEDFERSYFTARKLI